MLLENLDDQQLRSLLMAMTEDPAQRMAVEQLTREQMTDRLCSELAEDPARLDVVGAIVLGATASEVAAEPAVSPKSSTD